jgi:mycoredoxin
LSEDGVVLYGTAWCGHCRRPKKPLEGRGVEYAWVDVEGRMGARDEMFRLNGGDSRFPPLLFPDGSVLVGPMGAEPRAKLDGLAVQRTA